jgi:glyoxylase-like metal-dependent hydrolase (beta-lactamase superfamily II)
MVRSQMSRLIDVMHLGNDRVIGAYDVDGVIVDPGPASTVETLLEQAEPRVLLLTHIHLDHAGATGVLVRRNPDLKVYVHERGAPHLIDPSKLLKSAAQLYGDDMERLWGEVVPVPEENITVLRAASGSRASWSSTRQGTRRTTSPTSTRRAATRTWATWAECAYHRSTSR